MINQWLKNIATANVDDTTSALDFERVTAHLLTEVARADYEIDTGELETIVDAIAVSSSLEKEEVRSIVEAAIAEVDDHISYHEHTKFITDEFSLEQKRNLLDGMWRVAFADNELDRYEEAFIRRFAELIYMSHREFMQSKHRVLDKQA